MAGRRLVDAAKLFNASKSIASKHVALRSQQLDVYNRTSTLAKAVKNQTDRVTLTAQAAIALSKRFNEDKPSYTSTTSSQTARNDGDIPRKDTVQGERPHGDVKAGLEQDHHYDRSVENTKAEPPAEGELDVQQEKAKRSPLADGTIPSEGVILDNGLQGKDTFSERSVPEPPKQPLAEEQHQVRNADEGIKPTESTRSTIPLPGKPSGSLPGDSASDKGQYTLSGVDTIQHVSPTPQEAELQKGHDRDVFYARSKETKSEPSSLPREQIPKSTADKQESDDHVDDGRLNQDVFYSTPEPGQEELQREQLPHEVAVPEQEQIPEGVNTDVFRTKRVSRMLGGNPYAPKPQLDLKGAGSTPYDHTRTAQGHDQDTFNVRTSDQKTPSTPESPLREPQSATEKEMHDFASELAKDAESLPASVSEITGEITTEPRRAAYELRESRVPSSRFGRLWQYAGLGTSMALGAVGESLRRATGTAAAAGGSLMLSPGNIEILVAKLSRMRGAALKLGQMISLQDIKMLPPEIHEVLQRVQDSADYMPAGQRNKVLIKNLGPDWRDLFETFEDVPIAAASIGQVHKATLRSTGQPVAVKVQYPGVATSIDSDLNNLSILLTASRLLPSGMYLDKTIANARLELGWECNYTREAEYQQRFRELLSDDTDAFIVPKVFPEACGPEVLTAELMDGVGVTKLRSLTQDQRDWIGTQILRLCLREIVEFKLMQTDPNWTNFLFNAEKQKIELLDFGASREYPDKFVDPYVNVLIGASKGDKDAIRDLSIELGYLTGAESPTMLDAHIQSVLTLAEPFDANGPDVYDFSDQTITDRVRSLVPVMLRERLAPPPEETYSLHRKLSGAFLLCAKLGSRVPCKELFQNAVATYHRGGALKQPTSPKDV
ncbi:ubiquinone biosynthesis protein-like protein coq-8 [Aaosphaeria arxii CBS 175.79]|uniref:Ubiquinone biosynthesis protein-like protein coq-8 n=1 Tax=Aaosphaeria arxii CBS 175.79 TaxID=1450172 RepID=A0A6A5XHE7_9PLEO|nr:ubiquinone biosynthesis protein-like protein coq-8 [Aaosphaeria arxii CBS 175.79]KAF2012648.1 ubiquinone biosynthesis protein-like protein coq-8 [Aaosphaeria arxii CBS 175.79]